MRASLKSLLIAAAVLAAPALAMAATPAPADQSMSVQDVINQLTRQYKAGGSTMHFILALSILGVAFILERLFRLRRGVIAPTGLAISADALWKEGRFAEVEELARQRGSSTLGKIILFCVHHRGHGVDQVNAIASDIASRDLGRHTMYLFPLALVAVLSPLLGLFGTVIGMIGAFESVAVAGQMGDPSILSADISKALITTAYGLIVAMPILFFYHMLKLRTVFLANTLDEEAGTLITEWFLPKKVQSPTEERRQAQEVLR